ncbi:hypothetical protein [Serratia symbiotica]|uniref:hypothetical protein n=1 Tax=Serratia symbiotica TaxID=138074 RepID=UPI001CF0A6EC|nr:hypothetical protein [Serratia symbiotica]
MEILLLLLTVIAATLVAIYIRLGSLLPSNDVIPKESDTLEDIRGIREELERVNSSLEDIRYVSDLIEKYKLPDAGDRRVIDQIRIDNEISEAMDRSR